LSPYESGDATTEALRLGLRRGLREDPDDRLGARRTDEDAAPAVELAVGALGEHAALERAAEQQRRGKPVAGDVVAEDDDVAGLLASEDGVLSAQRLQHVAVADVGREHADPAPLHEP